MALQLTRPFVRLRPPPPQRRRSSRAHCLASSAGARAPCFTRPYTSVLVVPTGVGAAVGGFAGDALPVARALAAVADCVISHPNVLNAAMLYWPMPNTLYVEGYALDRFAEGSWALQPVHQNKGVDLLAGVEAIISHLIVKKFKIPAAHAPAVLPPALSPSVSPRSAAEETGYTFLPCVLAGLSNAPQYVMRRNGNMGNGCIVAGDVDSVILPKDACGGDGTIAFAQTSRKNKPLIITVQENETVLDDTPDKFNIEALNVQNYWEAIGVIAAHKAGVNPNALRRQGVDHLKRPLRLYPVQSRGSREATYSAAHTSLTI